MVSLDLVGVYEFFINLVGFLETLVGAISSNSPQALVTVANYFHQIELHGLSEFLYELEELITKMMESIGKYVPIIGTFYFDITLIEWYLYLCIGVVILLGFLKLLGDILPT